jgi:RHH-type transcriptional regulator, rel operon repressor / antitoxin RelB
MTYLTIPDELDKRLAELAAKAHVPKDEYALQALEEFLDDQEDYLVALSRSERIEKGIDTPLSFEEVLKELNLAETKDH